MPRRSFIDAMSEHGSVACRALRDRKRLALRYDGRDRVVEVHAVGWSEDGHGLMLAWQVRGGSASNATSGWKKLRLDQVASPHVINETSLAPRQGYKPDDAAMKGGITCQL